MKAFCLFCETNKCDYVAQIATLKFPCHALSPKQVQHIRSKGTMEDIIRDLLPGYVFLYTEDEELDMASIQSIQGVIRCLSDTEKQYRLTGSDEEFALMLLKKKGIIGKTQVYQEGQIIHICKGVFDGLETRILKVNHRNMRMQIEIPFASQRIKTWVEYEIVKLAEA